MPILSSAHYSRLFHSRTIEKRPPTCRRPLSSRSPLSFTNTISSRDNRTKSRGSGKGVESASPPSAMLIVIRLLNWLRNSLLKLAELVRRSELPLDPLKARTTSTSALNISTQNPHTSDRLNLCLEPASPNTLLTAPEVSGDLSSIMAPSGTQDSQEDSPETARAVNNQKHSNESSVSTQSLVIEGKTKKKNIVEENSKPDFIVTSKDGKLSGAERKKKDKEEKAARRAREKLNQQQQQQQQQRSPPESSNTANSIIQKGDISSRASAPTPKHQPKSTGPTGGTVQKSLPLRSAETTTEPIQEHKKEDKNVALFGHLYGNPRRTTTAGAGKDVHPAVLALGLQMSSYIICGSNARCIATLLVFKRVG